MAYAFTATHGVKFSEDGTTVWAHFTLDTTSTALVDGVTVRKYRFETADAKIAARLRKVEGYGITEAKSDKPEPDGDEK
jgi:hypothetical protein